MVHGEGADEFKLGVGHYEGAANPGETGNLVLSLPVDDLHIVVFGDLVYK